MRIRRKGTLPKGLLEERLGKNGAVEVEERCRMENPQAAPREQNLVVLLNGTKAMAKEKEELDCSKEAASASDIKVERDATGLDMQWTLTETFLLLEAKLKEHEMFVSSKRSSVTQDDRWTFISNFLKTRGIVRAKEKCREAWDRTLRDYKKVKEFEELKLTRCMSYFDMAASDRKLYLLPPDMSLDLYQRLDCARWLVKGGLSSVKREAREKMFVNEDSRSMKTVSHSVDGGTVGGTLEACMPNIVEATQVAGEEQRTKRRKASEILAAERKTSEAFNVNSFPSPADGGIGKIGEVSGVESIAYYIEAQGEQMASGAAVAEASYSRKPGEVCGTESFIYYKEAEGARMASGAVVPDTSYSRGQACQFNSGLISGGATGAASRQDEMTGQMICQHDKGISAVRESASQGLTAAAVAATDFDAGRCIWVQGTAELVKHIEDRRDARQKEALAFEREKLAALRDASDKAAVALTNAASVLSDVVRELFR